MPDEAVPNYVRVAGYAAIGLLFALVCAVGRLTTYFVLLAALLALLTPSIRQAQRLASRSPVDTIFLGSVITLAVALLASSDEWRDPLYILNFAPFLIAIPFRWQLERTARPDGALIVARLSLTGVIIAGLVAVVQVILLGYTRVGQPLMGAHDYAHTSMILGFLALVGCFAPGAHRRWPFLLGPILAIGAVLLSGTRGALLGAPALALVAFGFALATARRKGQILLAGAVAVAVVALLAAAAYFFGFERAISAFDSAGRVLAGQQIDESTRQRLLMLSGGLGAFLESPLFGHGWGDMVKAVYPHVPPDEVEMMTGFRQLHNGPMSFAVGAGVFGIAAFVALTIAPILAVLATPRDSQFVSRLYFAAVLVVGFAVFQLASIMLGFEFHTVQYAMMTMVFVAFVRDPAPPYSPGSAGPAPSTR
ncbi:MAG: O-antigen ligase family protein [Devosia sp.]|nr:O-antigen ligase family protein [Devosia sp.]